MKRFVFLSLGAVFIDIVKKVFQIVSHFTGPIDKKCIALSTFYWIILRYPADNLLGKQPILSSTLEVCPKDQ